MKLQPVFFPEDKDIPQASSGTSLLRAREQLTLCTNAAETKPELVALPVWDMGVPTVIHHARHNLQTCILPPVPLQRFMLVPQCWGLLYLHPLKSRKEEQAD